MLAGDIFADVEPAPVTGITTGTGTVKDKIKFRTALTLQLQVVLRFPR